jgi:putative endonuclease
LTENKKLTHILGRSGEEAAVHFLEKKKYRILERGFRWHRGEIDIIASDRSTIVFVEVKTRKSYDFGLPEESVTPSKQRQVRKIAEAYLQKKHLQDVECRFDVLSIFLTELGGFEINHIQDAF